MPVRLLPVALATAAALAVPTVLVAPEATGAQEQPAVVDEVPVPDFAQLVATERVPRPRVDAIASHRGVTFVGGRFTKLVDSAGTHRRRNLAALDSETGQVLDYPLTVDGPVLSLAARGRALYVGGSFDRVNDRSRSNLAKVDAATGELVRDFKPALDATVKEVAAVGKRLFVGGTFSGALLSLHRGTGQPTRYLQVPVLGSLRPSQGRTSVYRFAVDPDRTRLVAVGNFTYVGGQERRRAFMLNLAPRRARLASWTYAPLMQRCRARKLPKVANISDVDFSPDGSWFVLSATGGHITDPADLGTKLCDAVARFETDIPAPTEPTWINYTGGDTVWTVAATGPAVYAEGHFRWVSNPEGRDDEGPGAVDRRGLAALDPATGDALAWHPAMPSQRGGRALLATRGGLWAGSDAATVGREPRRGLAFFPLPEPTEPPTEPDPTEPPPSP